MKCNYPWSFSGKRARLDKHFSTFLLLGGNERKKGHFKEMKNLRQQVGNAECWDLTGHFNTWKCYLIHVT